MPPVQSRFTFLNCQARLISSILYKCYGGWHGFKFRSANVVVSVMNSSILWDISASFYWLGQRCVVLFFLGWIWYPFMWMRSWIRCCRMLFTKDILLLSEQHTCGRNHIFDWLLNKQPKILFSVLFLSISLTIIKFCFLSGVFAYWAFHLMKFQIMHFGFVFLPLISVQIVRNPFESSSPVLSQVWKPI